LAVKDSLLRHLGPFGKPWAVAGETAILPLLAVAIGIWVNPLDPLWINASFPWVWFAPVILAMRYGPFPGLEGRLCCCSPGWPSTPPAGSSVSSRN
jgi:hypothetical protein